MVQNTNDTCILSYLKDLWRPFWAQTKLTDVKSVLHRNKMIQ